MAGNLRSRLSAIRRSQAADKRAAETADPAKTSGKPESGKGWPSAPASLSGVFSAWEKAGDGVLRRRLSLPLARPVPAALPWTLPVVLPDLAGAGLSPERILFFDLETTGLSGGAGTVAFLAAFGTFGEPERGEHAVPEHTALRTLRVLRIDQFLLLDYSGELAFLDAVLLFINDSLFPARYLTTYNGKSFDSQILKTRCLMNGFHPPKLPQLDLLYPSRRMWKRILPNCSQATVETMALGLDRTGDIPGSLAPDIWFDFLKSGGSEAAARRLLGICDHNVKDIEGLAALFAVFCGIAERPLDASAAFRCDTERLAMIWRRQQRLPPLFQDTDAPGEGLEETSSLLLEAAARHYPRSCLRLGFDLFRKGRFEEGRAALARIADGNGSWRVPCGPVVTALALRSLAIDAARRLGSAGQAAAFLEKALLLDRREEGGLPRGLREDLERRLAALRPC
ncbi:MAG: ribonuclease H-like domain-containing protein [Treponema sp.]|jgi:uncharacterized protein YprB with RNaseH-like and TPR domain|nr:ribonuclease H-like domain-containing protein [Treponema sp.]